MKKKLLVMVAAPGCGKSTFIKNHMTSFAGRVVVVSRDDIRFKLVSEKEEYFSKEKQVFKEYIESIKTGFKNGDTVIADATHLNVASRNKLLYSLGSSLKDVEVDAIVIDVCLAKALEQNEKRAGTRSYVPPTAVRRMFEQFTMPQLEEGFDKIYIYNPTDKVKYKIIEKGE